MTRWRRVGFIERIAMEWALRRSLPTGHILEGVKFRGYACRDDCDDVAFTVEGRGLCIVHATHRREHDTRFPQAIFVKELPEQDS